MAAISGTSGVDGTPRPIVQTQAPQKRTALVATEGVATAAAESANQPWNAKSTASNKTWSLNGAKPAASEDESQVVAHSEAQAKRLAEKPAEDVGPNSPVYKHLAGSKVYSNEQIQEMLSTKGGVMGAKNLMAAANSQETASFWSSASKLAEIAFELLKAMIAGWRV